MAAVAAVVERGPAPFPSGWVEDRLAVIHTLLPPNLVGSRCDPSAAALTAAQPFTLQPPLHVVWQGRQGDARPSPSPRLARVHVAATTPAPALADGCWACGRQCLARAACACAHTPRQGADPAAGATRRQRRVGATEATCGCAAHAAYTAAVEDANAIAHVFVERQDFTAKEEDGEDEGLVYQRFHTRRHLPGGE